MANTQSEVQCQLTAKVEDDKIVIEIPMALLVFAEKNRPDGPYTVTDEEAMAKYVADRILEFGENEAGDSAFHRLLDKLFDEAYENAEEWLETDGDWDS